tara:strand:+ start:1152 stop:1361 length:210 start_codon:yes stop_codon:yes gene_type:complete
MQSHNLMIFVGMNANSLMLPLSLLTMEDVPNEISGTTVVGSNLSLRTAINRYISLTVAVSIARADCTLM